MNCKNCLFLTTISIILCVSSCVSGIMNTWPTQAYGLECNLPMFKPITPFCIDIGSGKVFRDDDEMKSCRKSLANYERALKSWSTCVVQDLQNEVEEFQNQSGHTLTCLVQVTYDNSQPIHCDPIIAQIDNNLHLARRIWSTAERPSCTGNLNRLHQFGIYRTEFHKWLGRVENCKQEMIAFLNTVEDEIKKLQYNLLQETRRSLYNETRKFNCKANGICF